MSTFHELVATARRRIQAAGVPQAEADLDARLLLERLLGWDAARYFAHGHEPADGEIIRRYQTCIDRRVAREPVAYISGIQEFWGLPFEVSPAVLIPRPETELIVELSLALHPEGRPLQVADVCTGSGCLAVALARERPQARVLATDVSAAALGVAVRNFARHRVAERVMPLQTDLLTAAAGPFDLIVSNPPYVPLGDVSTLQPEVVRHEPHVALCGGADGLEVIRRLVMQTPSRLSPDGTLIVEFGYGQAAAIAALVGETSGLELVDIRSDLQGIPRTAIARRR